MNTHEFYMNRCLQLAKNGLGTTYPNPLVGSVIVHEGKIIGEGWHRKSGEPHAEVLAIQSVKDRTLLKEATLYVNLEPCSHFGKTPPCCDLILQHDIPNVVIGTIDSHSKVAGKGIHKLKEQGKNVTVGVLEKTCLELNKRFFTFHTKKRPFIILKWAETKDGFIAPIMPELTEHNQLQPIWITNVYSRQLVHKWRSEEEAILVGTKTVLTDNPHLNTRDWAGKNPIRLVIDKSGKINPNFNVKDNKQTTLIFTEQENYKNSEHTNYENVIFDKNLIFNILKIAFEKNISSILVEGGRETLQSFIDIDLWDEIRMFTGNEKFGNGIKAPVFNGKPIFEQTLNGDQLKIFCNYD